MPDARSPSSATNSLCGVCRRVLDEVSTPGCHTDLVHQENRADLEKSASSACGICTRLLDELRSIEHQLSSVSLNEAFPVTCESDTSAASWQKSFEIRLSCRRIEPFEALSLSFVLEVVEGPTDLPTTYTPSTSTDSPECQALIKQWLHECESSHERCNASVPEAWAPSRILDVGRGDEGYSKIWLVTQDKTQFSKEPYATLSHCWGSADFIRLASYNIAKFVSEGISRKTLPKTFDDAIDIVRCLGIRYLWIDALCIVQDNFDDWAHEAGLMSKVYRYCSVNIAAAGAADSKGGCYRTRDSQIVQRTEFDIQWRNGNESGPSTYYVVPEPRIWRQKLLDEPLNQRCWVVQERILSPRTLQFGRQQLFWECREKIACETYHRGLPVSLQGDTFIAIKTLELGDETSDDRWPALHVSKNSGIAPTLFGSMWNKFTELFRPIVRQEVTLYATKRSGAVYRDWDTVVELYSLGELTFANDKLIAIAGIAEAISRGEENFPNDGYLAGLWHSSLPSHLLWTTENVNVLRHGVWQPKAPERYHKYIAPSWSWPSVNGKISFEWCQRDFDKTDYLATMVDVHITQRTEYRFGSVVSGHLTILAPIASCLWTSEDKIPSARPSLAAITQIFPLGENCDVAAQTFPATTSQLEKMCFDTAEASTSKEIILLPVIGTMQKTAHDTEAIFALILRKALQSDIRRASFSTRSGDCYLRIGFLYTGRPQVCRILRNMQRQSVTII